MIKRAGVLLVFFAIAAGFGALIAWGLQSGVAAGKYGAATRAETPGLYWFFIMGLVIMALIAIAQGIKAIMPGFRARRLVLPGFALLLPCAIWAIVDLIKSFWTAIMQVPELSGRLIYAGLAIMVLGVFVMLLYTLIWPEVQGLWRGGDQADD